MANHTYKTGSQSSTWQGGFGYEHGMAVIILILLWWLPRANSFRPKPVTGLTSAAVSKPTRSLLEFLPPYLIPSDDEEEPDSKSLASGEVEPLPAATETERERFLIARRGDEVAGTKSLTSYLEWRHEHQRISDKLEIGVTDDNDLNDWNLAAATAMKARGDGDSCDDSSKTFFLPRIARFHRIGDSDACDRDGFRLIHIIPGQMDDRLAKLTTYALAISLYLDAKLDAGSSEMLTVLVDVRGGQGWPNTHPVRLLPFIKDTIQLLLSMFPERLHKCLLYPLPPATLWIWNIVRKCIDPKTAQKIQILTGEARIVSDPPYSQMEEHIETDIVQLLESTRRAAFLQSGQI